MHINAFYLDSFGALRDITLEGIPKGFVIFVGRNEAGKSTLLDFFRCILTGYPQKTHDDREESYLAGGANSGGKLLLDTEQGQIRLTRRPGAKGGLTTLLDANGNPLDISVLDRLLCGVTREVYSSIYGFSLSELQNFSSLNSEGVKNALYGASFGLGLHHSPGDAIKYLDKAMQDIFKPGGSRPLLSASLKNWEEIQKEIRNNEESAASYDTLALKVEELQKNLISLHKERDELEKEQHSLEKRLNVWKEWEEWRLIGMSLNRLEEVPATFPQNGPDRLDQALQRRENTKRDVTLAEERLQKICDKLNATVIDEKLLAAGGELDDLAERKASCRNALGAIPDLQNSFNRTKSDIQQELARLGSDWNIDRVLQINRSLLLRENVENRAEELHKAVSAKDTANDRLKFTQQEELAAEQALQTAQETYKSLPMPVVEISNEERESLQQELAQTEDAQRGLKERGTALENARYEFGRALNYLHLQPKTNTEEALKKLSDVQEDVLNLAKDAKKQQAELLESGRVLDHARDEERRARERLDKLQNQRDDLGGSDRSTLNVQRRSVRALQAAMARLPGEESNLSEAEDRLNSHLADRPGSDRNYLFLITGCVMAVAGASALAAHYIFGMEILNLSQNVTVPVDSWLGYLVFIAGMVFLGAGLPRRRPEAERYEIVAEQLRNRVSVAQNQLDEEQKNIQKLCQSLNLESPHSSKDEPAFSAMLDQLESELDQKQEEFADGERLDHAITDHNDEVENLRRTTQDLEVAYNKKSADVQLSRRRWQDRLIELGVQNIPSADQADAYFARVDNARSALNNVDTLKKEVQKMENRGIRLIDLAKRLLPETAWLGLDSEKTPLEATLAAVHRVLESCQKADQAAEARTRAQESIRGAEAQMKRVCTMKAEANNHVAKAEKALSIAKKNWGDCLGQLGFDKSLSPATAREALECVDRILKLIGDQDRQSDDLAKQKGERDGLLVPLRALLKKLDRAVEDTSEEALISQLDSTRRDCESERAALTNRSNLKNQRDESTKTLDQAKAVYADAVKNLNTLLTMAEAKDPEDFLRKYKALCERDKLIHRRNELEDSLRLVALDSIRLADGKDQLSEEAFQTFLSGFAEAEQEERSARLKEVIDRLAVITEKEKQLGNEIRDGEIRLNTLTESDRLAELRLREAAIVDEIQGLSMKWSRYAFAKKLLETAKNHFEKERQPEVIRMASSLFANITNNEWQSVTMSLEDNSLQVISKHGQPMKPDFLSRGTKEQLYLALRLAHIQHHAMHATALPVIMDDILVNFDSERADRAALTIDSLCHGSGENSPSQQHQVLFFTCHRYMAYKLKELIQGCALYNFDHNTITKVD